MPRILVMSVKDLKNQFNNFILYTDMDEPGQNQSPNGRSIG